MNKLKDKIIYMLQNNQLSIGELYHLCSPEYTRSQVCCVLGMLQAAGEITKTPDENWELINE